MMYTDGSYCEHGREILDKKAETSAKDKKSKATVLVIYSSNTVEKERELIMTMMSELNLYDEIELLSPDFTCIQGSSSAWLEREVKKATTVLCVCNKEFRDEWEGQSHPCLQFNLVKSLKHLILATVQSQDENLFKYAVVLLNPSHRQYYIPTKYLQSESRSFIVEETKDIAHYVLKTPHCELASSPGPSPR